MQYNKLSIGRKHICTPSTNNNSKFTENSNNYEKYIEQVFTAPHYIPLRVYNIESIENEGILVSSIYNGQELHIKLQTQNYKVYQETCSPKYNVKSSLQYIYLYQTNNLDIYLAKFEDEIGTKRNYIDEIRMRKDIIVPI